MNYYLAATALRAFSATTWTKAIYRWIGNRKTVRQLSAERAGWVLEKLNQVPTTEPERFLELGTGWMHAYSLYPALTRNAEIHAFDVWDNRSFAAFQNAVTQLPDHVARLDLTAGQRDAADRKIAALGSAADFDQAYQTLNLHYAYAHDGRLPYPENHFDAIYSVDVLEHVVASGFDTVAEDWFRVLKPGGRLLAQVGLDDHLAHYDGSKSRKHYLRHSKSLFDNWLENDVQYINRIPATDMMDRLKRVGFQVLEAERLLVDDPENLPVHQDYRDQPAEDVATYRLNLVIEKPHG